MFPELARIYMFLNVTIHVVSWNLFISYFIQFITFDTNASIHL
jgi:hypothetical protein